MASHSCLVNTINLRVSAYLKVKATTNAIALLLAVDVKSVLLNDFGFYSHAEVGRDVKLRELSINVSIYN